MHHPFDGIILPDVPAKAVSESVVSTRRSALRSLLAATAGVLGWHGLAAARQRLASTRAAGEEGGQVVTRARGEAGITTQRIGEEGGHGPLPAPQSVDLSEKQLADAWSQLGDADRGKAEAAFKTLYSARGNIAFLKARLKTEPMAIDEKQFNALMEGLDADEFAEREKTSAEILKLGPAWLLSPTVQAAIKQTKSLEARRRLEMLVLKMRESGPLAQARRGLEILAILPSKDARAVVEALTQESPETWLTAEAKEALKPPTVQPPIRRFGKGG